MGPKRGQNDYFQFWAGPFGLGPHLPENGAEFEKQKQFPYHFDTNFLKLVLTLPAPNQNDTFWFSKGL